MNAKLFIAKPVADNSGADYRLTLAGSPTPRMLTGHGNG
jgi:hypothetical protein